MSKSYYGIFNDYPLKMSERGVVTSISKYILCWRNAEAKHSAILSSDRFEWANATNFAVKFGDKKTASLFAKSLKASGRVYAERLKKGGF